MTDDNLKKYEEYFKDSFDQLDEEFHKSKEYSEKIDRQIQLFDSAAVPSKGGQHYLIEHIKNAISLQTQRQSIIKDKFSIKKAILDYSFKTDDQESNSNKDLFEEISKMIKETKEINKDLVPKNVTKNIDSEIDGLVEDYDVEED